MDPSGLKWYTRIAKKTGPFSRWSIKTTVKWKVEKKKIKEVKVTQSRSYKFPTYVNREGYTRMIGQTEGAIASYYHVSASFSPVWVIWKHTVNIKSNGKAWHWTASDVWGSVPNTIN